MSRTSSRSTTIRHTPVSSVSAGQDKPPVLGLRQSLKTLALTRVVADRIGWGGLFPTSQHADIPHWAARGIHNICIPRLFRAVLRRSSGVHRCNLPNFSSQLLQPFQWLAPPPSRLLKPTRRALCNHSPARTRVKPRLEISQCLRIRTPPRSARRMGQQWARAALVTPAPQARWVTRQRTV